MGRKDRVARKVGVNQPAQTTSGQSNAPIQAVQRSPGDLSIRQPSTSSRATGGDAVSQFPAKKYGKIGRPVKLKANVFKITLNKPPPHFHYNIEIVNDEPAAAATAAQQQQKSTVPKSKRTRKELNDLVFAGLFKQHSAIFTATFLPVFDGEKNFYSTNQMAIPNNSWSGLVEVQDHDRTIKMRVNVTVPEMSHGQNLSRLLNTNQIMPVELQALDIIMRNGPRLAKVII